MSTVIFLTRERMALARARLAGRHLAPRKLSASDRLRRLEHAGRMLAFLEAAEYGRAADPREVDQHGMARGLTEASRDERLGANHAKTPHIGA